LQSIFGDEQVSVQDLNQGSRTATWSTFYPYISDKPFLGNGFGSFQGGGLNRKGPHNTFLLVWGEAGIFALLIFLGLYLYLLRKSLGVFYQKPHLTMMSVSLILFLLTNHNYFTAYAIIFISMWIFIESHKIEAHES
ncbi:MAG: O-antigen ligase family protein, partial [Flavobacteriaceae bacterium]